LILDGPWGIHRDLALDDRFVRQHQRDGLIGPQLLHLIPLDRDLPSVGCLELQRLLRLPDQCAGQPIAVSHHELVG
jgi:hypothetical protein